MAIKITAPKSLVFDFPEYDTFVISEGLTFNLKPSKTGTFFFWKTRNKRRVTRFVPLPLIEINKFIKQKSA